MSVPSVMLFVLVAAQTPPIAPPPGAPAPAQAAPAAAAPAAAQPEAAETAIKSGLAAYRKRNFRRAQEEFRRATEANPASAAAHYYLGYAYYKAGERRHTNKREAAASFAKAYELDAGFRPDWGRAPKED